MGASRVVVGVRVWLETTKSSPNLRGRVAGGGDEAEGGLVGDDFDADEVDLLEVGAVVAGGGEAVEGELGGDVFGGELAAAQAGIAAFEEVVGDELVLGADVGGADGGFDCGDGAKRDVRVGLGEEWCGCGREEGQEGCCRDAVDIRVRHPSFIKRGRWASIWVDVCGLGGWCGEKRRSRFLRCAAE